MSVLHVCVFRSWSRKSHDCLVTKVARPLKGGGASSSVSFKQASCSIWDQQRERQWLHWIFFLFYSIIWYTYSICIHIYCMCVGVYTVCTAYSPHSVYAFHHMTRYLMCSFLNPGSLHQIKCCVCERGSSPEGTWSRREARLSKWLQQCKRRAHLPLMSLGWKDSGEVKGKILIEHQRDGEEY